MRKTIGFIIFIVLMTLITSYPAFALSAKITGTVNFVYTNNATTPVNIINVTYSNGGTTYTSNFIIPTANANFFIAMALTAQSAGKQISFQTEGSTLYSLWVNS